MSNFLKKNAKIILLFYIVLIAINILFACFYMTQYQNIHIFSRIEGDQVLYEENLTLYDNGASNTFLFGIFNGGKDGGSNYLTDTTNPYYEEVISYYNEFVKGKSGLVWDEELGTFVDNTPKNFLAATMYGDSGLTYAQFIDNFRIGLNDFNDALIIYGIVCIILAALFYLMGNHSRNVYYNSNLIVGILSPLAIIVYSVIMIVQNLGLQATFNENIELFKIAAVLTNPNTIDRVKSSYLSEGGYAKLMDAASGINDTTFTVATVLLSLVCVASVFMIVYTAYRYKASSKRRAEVIERAVQNND